MSKIKSLGECFTEYGCDKAEKHGYDKIYEKILHPFLRNNHQIHILEIGIFYGASIAAWVEYLDQYDSPYRIHGIDTFQRVEAQVIPILEHPCVSWTQADSTDHEMVKHLAEDFDHETIAFNLIIDDGLHTSVAQRATFENYFKFLHGDGSYCIEDVWPILLMDEEQKEHPWIKGKEGYSEENYCRLIDNLGDCGRVNSHDNREKHDPDSFILEVNPRRPKGGNYMMELKR